MDGKVVLVTGANSGIGKEAAIELARRGATVLITARSELRGGQALSEVRRRSRASDDRVQLVALDLARFSSIRACAATVLERWDRLDVLACNAGAMLSDRRVTEEGFEMTFGANHLGHFLLTQLLIDRVTEGEPGRVVVTSSFAHRLAGGLPFADLQHERSYTGVAAYNESKLANVLFTMELARRLEGTGVTANCLHPGPVRTSFASAEDTTGGERLMFALARPFMVTAHRGAQPIIELSSSPKYDGVTGGYFVAGYAARCARRTPAAPGRDPAAARKLWEISEELVATASA